MTFFFEDRYFFLSDLAIAEDIVGTSTEPLIKGRMHDEFIDKAIEETKKLEEKLKKYEENNISEFERKKKEIELKKIRINDESESKKNLSIEERLTLSLKKVYKAKLELNKCLEEYTNND